MHARSPVSRECIPVIDSGINSAALQMHAWLPALPGRCTQNCRERAPCIPDLQHSIHLAELLLQAPLCPGNVPRVPLHQPALALQQTSLGFEHILLCRGCTHSEGLPLQATHLAQPSEHSKLRDMQLLQKACDIMLLLPVMSVVCHANCVHSWDCSFDTLLVM